MSNGKRGAQPGNENAKSASLWRYALKRALARAGSTVESGLDRIADRLVAAATEGTPWAIEHLADRLDGRAVQHIAGTIEHTVTTGDEESLTERLAARHETPKHPIQ